jgi:hypothetical protein
MLLTMVPAVACLLLMRKPPAAAMAPVSAGHTVMD